MQATPLNGSKGAHNHYPHRSSASLIVQGLLDKGSALASALAWWRLRCSPHTQLQVKHVSSFAFCFFSGKYRFHVAYSTMSKPGYATEADLAAMAAEHDAWLDSVDASNIKPLDDNWKDHPFWADAEDARNPDTAAGKAIADMQSEFSPEERAESCKVHLSSPGCHNMLLLQAPPGGTSREACRSGRPGHVNISHEQRVEHCPCGALHSPLLDFQRHCAGMLKHGRFLPYHW